MDGSITVPNSVFVNGQWATAHWMADVVDDSTGELVITATLAGEAGSAPVVTALRMDMALARELRALAGFGGTGAVDEARAKLAYWRESMECAAGILAKGRNPGQNIVTAAGLAEDYLRQLLALDEPVPVDGSDAEPAYDCRTTGERLQDVEQRLAALEIVGPRRAGGYFLPGGRLIDIEERLKTLEAWQVAVAMDTAEDNSLFQIYDAVARRERAKAGA